MKILFVKISEKTRIEAGAAVCVRIPEFEQLGYVAPLTQLTFYNEIQQSMRLKMSDFFLLMQLMESNLVYSKSLSELRCPIIILVNSTTNWNIKHIGAVLASNPAAMGLILFTSPWINWCIKSF